MLRRYASAVGEYLMTLPQQLETWMVAGDEDDESAHIDAEWLDKVARVALPQQRFTAPRDARLGLPVVSSAAAKATQTLFLSHNLHCALRLFVYYVGVRVHFQVPHGAFTGQYSATYLPVHLLLSTITAIHSSLFRM